MDDLIYLLGSLVVFAAGVVVVVATWLGARLMLHRMGGRSGLEFVTPSELTALEARIAALEAERLAPAGSASGGDGDAANGAVV